MEDKLLGSLIGLIVGDALGTTLEFYPRDSYLPIEDMVGGGPFDLLPGEWTDDSSMALCLAESLTQSKGFNPKNQMETYCKWYKEGHLSSNGTCFDIGITTSTSLEEFSHFGDPYCGPVDERSSGNGSIMRLAPIPIYFRDSLEETIKYSELSSMTTHGSKLCRDSCKFLGALLFYSFQGRELILDPKGFRSEVVSLIKGDYKKKTRCEISSKGFVISTLEAALWAFHNSKDFKEGLLLAVNLGEDSDTVGAVYGQIAGAYYGLSGIPKEWVRKLAKFELIMKIGEKLVNEQ